MYRCKPSKWILPAIIGAGLPLLGAWFLQGDSVKGKFAANCSTALSGVGADWAKCETDGLCAKITGEAPDEDSVTKALTAVRAVSSYCDVASVATITPPVVLPEVVTTPIAPDFHAGMDQIFGGKWPSAIATTLAVTVAAKTYELGKSPELTAKGDDWSLNLGNTLAAGSYELTTKVTDGKNAVLESPPIKFTVNDPPPPPPKVEEAPKVEEKKAEMAEIKPIVVPPPHGPPTVDMVSSDQPVTMLTGTWDSTGGKRLRVNVNGKTYRSGGADGALKNEGDKWSLTLAEPLGPGSYSVLATSADEISRLQNDSTSSEVLVSPPPPKPADAIVFVDAAAPTVAKQVTTSSVGVITGTWDSKNAKRLRVAVPAQKLVARLGAADGALTADGDNWSLKLATPLDIGTYEVMATSSDDNFRAKSDSETNDIIVTAAPKAADPIVMVDAAAPTVAKQVTTSAVSVITGTWDSKNAKRLRVAVPSQNLVARLGAADGALKADGDSWSLALATPLDVGTYEVVATSSDDNFRAKSDKETNDIIVTAPPKAAEVVVMPEASAPTVNRQTSNQPIGAISGTWDATNAKRLRVFLPIRNLTARLGDGALAADGNTWTLTLAEPLGQGSYDVTATSSDGDFRPKSDTTSSEIIVEPPPPKPAEVAAMVEAAAPAVNSIKTSRNVTRVTGRWDSKNAKRLRVSIAGQDLSARLGQPNLVTVGDGWSWTLDRPLAEGTYEVVATSSDADFRAKSDASASEIVVMAAPAPEPAPAPAVKPIVSDVKIPEPRPIDCEAVLVRVNKVFPILFDYDKTDLKSQSNLALSQYAALLKDPRCASLTVGLSGHADIRGQTAYNQRLSDRRVARVVKALTEAGIDAARLKGSGFSENVPVDPATTEEAFAKNRRVDITVAK
jgi:outer membrane protein OmpA-like peptidoglycan-associated protein/lipoprotein-anchoring transpeptidase ErfK/SrfK